MAEHNSLTGGSLHEPKDVATAGVDTLYHADGAGSGVWKLTQAATHGEMALVTNTQALAVSAATDSSLNTDSDYIKLGLTGAWQAGLLANGMVFTGTGLTVPLTGHYQVSFWASMEVSNNNTLVAVKYGVNGLAPFSTRKVLTQSNNANNVLNVAGLGLVALTAGDTIELFIAADDNTNVTARDTGFILKLL